MKRQNSNQKSTFFLSGIGTEIGKTVCSALIAERMQCEYWKPVQAGELEYTDSHKIADWTSLKPSQIHPERYRLETPMSPHAAAKIDGKNIQLIDFQLPNTNNDLLIEGAGGLLVPLNEQHTILDLIAYLQLPVILVSRNYLGSINHTLLSIEVLQKRNIPLHGIIFNGPSTPSTESIIKKLTGVRILAKIPELNEISSSNIRSEAATLPAFW